MADYEQVNWGIAGAGTIGGELFDQVAQEHVAKRLGLDQFPSFVLRSSGLMTPEGPVESINDYVLPHNPEEIYGHEAPDVLFIALPSDDESGALALRLTKWATQQGSVVITAEKGMLANHWDKARNTSDNFRLLGINATVGGGNRLIDAIRIHTRDPENIQQLHVALNGTLTYMLSEMSHGVPLGIATSAAKKLGYAEPEAQNPFDVLRGEAEGDIPKKTSILFNALGLGPTLDWRELQFTLTNDELSQLTEEVKERRFIVSLYANGNEPETGRIGGFDVQHGRWRIVGGFRLTAKNPMFAEIASYAGTANGGKIGLGPNMVDGAYPIAGGPGAGPEPTVNTMLDDRLKILCQK